MGTKQNPGKFDCYAAAAPDEPLFTLLGRDRHAPTLVRIWALLRDAAGEDEDKVEEALKCADAMDNFRINRGKPLPVEERPRVEAILFAATDGLAEHPEGYDEVCNCDECRSSG